MATWGNKKKQSASSCQGRRSTSQIDENTYISAIAGQSFRTLMAIAARFDLKLIQYDVVNTFVNANLSRDIYMPMLPEFGRPGQILKLLDVP
jgi:hypothetical protein